MFIDKNMPSMDGISLLRQLRENHYTGFVVGLTGEDRQEVVEDFLTNGADMVVTKPLDSKKLRQVMKQVNRSV
jgi:DNA-binding response OmpR family regulator